MHEMELLARSRGENISDEDRESSEISEIFQFLQSLHCFSTKVEKYFLFIPIYKTNILCHGASIKNIYNSTHYKPQAFLALSVFFQF